MSRKPRSTGSVLSLLSFIAVMLLALSLVLTYILQKVGVSTQICGFIEKIAFAIALIVPLFYSYYEARRQGTVWFVLWVIAFILIVVFYVLGWL